MRLLVSSSSRERSRAGSSTADSQTGSSACRTGRVTGETVGVQQQQGALQGRVQRRRQPDRVLSLSDRESHW